jgi:hypothetical protein
MVNKRNLLGILVMALVFGMSVVGCGNDDSGNGGNSEGKKITITGITRSTGMIMIMLMSESEGGVAMGMSQISNSSATVDLLNEDETAWTGSGSYFIQMAVGSLSDDTDGETYVFTDGKTFTELGITDTEDGEQLMKKLPKYNISGTVSTIAFNKFKEISN